MIIRFTKLIIIFLFYLLLIYSCAKIGSPTGGQTDKIPPKVVRSIPTNGTVNFNGDKIYITFDEFIQLNKINENLIVSPPLKNEIKTSIKHKTLIIDLNNKLEDDVTYCLNFGNSIVDFHESNPLENFEFVFSTGNKIDSFSLVGKVLKAFELEPPEKNTFVLVHNNLNDTAPLTLRPLYVGRCDKSGEFKINYLKEGKYKIYALTDKNNNLKYDLQDEQFAFIDSIIEINENIFNKNKIFVLDSNIIDSSKVDSLIIEKNLSRTYNINLNLRIFKEEVKNQYVSSKSRPDSIKIVIGFNRDLINDNFEIELLNSIPSKKQWYLKELNQKKDTIIIWLIDSVLYSQDTLKTIIKYSIIDSSENINNKLDTINFIYFGRKEIKNRVEKNYKININISLLGRGIKELDEELYIISPFPIIKVNKELLKLQRLKDTIVEDVPIFAKIDTLDYRKIKIEADFKAGEKYRLIANEGAIRSFYNHFSDTLNILFECRKEDYYGKLLVNFDKTDKNDVIVQLLNMKGLVVREEMIEDKEKLVFNYLQPGQYKLRAYIDKNKNNKWDTGNFKKKLQPEIVIYYPENIEIRSNWEVEINWQNFK